MAKKHYGIFEKKRKDGRTSYQVKWRLADGTQRSKAFPTLTEAKAFKATVQVERGRGLDHDPARGKITFADFADRWVTTRSTHRESTARRRDGIIAKHLKPELGAMQLGRIQRDHIETAVARWVKAGLAPRTILNHLHVLGPIFDAAVANDIIAKSPMQGLKPPRAPKPNPRALSPEEIIRLLEAISADYRPMIETMLSTGVRWSELANLNIADLNWFRPELTIRTSKSDAGQRTITLTQSDIDVIAAHLAATGRNAADGDQPLFTSPQGHRLNYRNFAQRVFIPALKKAGIQNASLHTLRRTHATMLVEAGATPKVVMQRMGHESIQTTLTYYTDTSEQARRDAANVMTQYLGRAKSAPEATAAEAN